MTNDLFKKLFILLTKNMLQKIQGFWVLIELAAPSIVIYQKDVVYQAIENQQCNYEAASVKIRQRIVSFINVLNVLFSSVTNNWSKVQWWSINCCIFLQFWSFFRDSIFFKKKGQFLMAKVGNTVFLRPLWAIGSISCDNLVL